MAIVLTIKFTFLFLNLCKIQIFIPKSTEGEGGSAGLGIIPKKSVFLSASLTTHKLGQSSSSTCCSSCMYIVQGVQKPENKRELIHEMTALVGCVCILILFIFYNGPKNCDMQ